MTPGQKKLFLLLGDYASKVMSDFRCNDLTDEMNDCLTPEEWDGLMLEMHTENGDPEEFVSGRRPPNWWAFLHLLQKIVKES